MTTKDTIQTVITQLWDNNIKNINFSRLSTPDEIDRHIISIEFENDGIRVYERKGGDAPWIEVQGYTDRPAGILKKS